jgi:hypothetical protein
MQKSATFAHPLDGNHRMNLLRAASFSICAAFVSFVYSSNVFACSSCGCTLNSDWSSQGLSVGRGWRFDWRYDYFNQSQLRSGIDSVAASGFARPADVEVQQTTINRNTNFALEYNPTRNYGVSIQLPYFDRYHTTIAEGDTAISGSRSKSIGDLRVVGHFQGFRRNNFGVQFGLKLATGSHREDFRSGPQAGEDLDRGLQPGTGTTDLLLGLYNFGQISDDWSYFGHAMLQQPLNSKDQFKPGAGVNASLGIRYSANQTWVPQLQLNARVERRESGASADVENSGASLVYVSPGVTINFSRRWAAFVFYQAPIYQRVNGLQIEPKQLFSIGAHYIF